MLRRDFLKFGSLAPVSLYLPGLVAGKTFPQRSILLLVELKGGNDGLNTVIPYHDPAYYRLRPRLAIARDEVIQLDDKTGLHPSLKPLFKTWQSGEIAIVQGVGYPEPNLSHFRSIEIWDAGTDSDKYSQEGWLPRVFGGKPAGADLIADGIVVGQDAGPLDGPQFRTLVMADPEKFIRNARRVQADSQRTGNPALDHILSVETDVQSAARTLESRLVEKGPDISGFPANRFGRQCALAAKIIANDIPTAVIKLSHGSFDTHTNQAVQQGRLLKELAEGLASLQASCRASGHWDNVLIMTYSEFGRRATENGNAGTDHGTAAPHFLIGGRIRGGLYGRQPALTDLDGGNLRFTTDFRQLYATVSGSWLGMEARANPFAEHADIGCIRRI